MGLGSPARSPDGLRLDYLGVMFKNIAKFLAAVEPVWVATCVALVFVFHIFGWHLLGTRSGFLWLWLGLGLVPIILRRMVYGRVEFATPFDFSIALLMLGALIGVIASPQYDLSLGAFQCMLAMCLVYYSWLSHPRLATMMRFALPLSLLGLLIAFLVVFPQLGKPASDPESLPNTYHGLAMCLLVAAIILGAVALFRGHKKERVAAGLISLCLLIATFMIVRESLPRLAHGDSVGGRLARWETTVSLLRDSPFTGLGLGCWAFVYHHDSMTIVPPTHVHNAYLELYANTGILGLIALIIALGVGAKLALQIVKSPRDSEWYGFGIGVVVACLAVLVVGILESAPVGVAVPQSNTYFYLISPAPWILCGLMVIAHRLITRGTTG